MYGVCVHSTRRSLNNARTGTVCKRFRRNNGHLTLQIWTHCRHHVWEAMHETFWKFRQKPDAVSEWKVTLEKAWKNFPQNKAVPRCRKRLREYEKSSGRHVEQLLLTTFSIGNSYDFKTPFLEVVSWTNRTTTVLKINLKKKLRYQLEGKCTLWRYKSTPTWRKWGWIFHMELYSVTPASNAACYQSY